MSADAELGRTIWKALHAIAINFPDNAKGLNEDILKGYFAFFQSLKVVLPRKKWQNAWEVATRNALNWNVFKHLENHKQLFEWLSRVHDDIRKALGQPVVPGKDWYPLYKKYRKGAGSANANVKNNSNTVKLNATALATITKLKQMLRVRLTPMDEYLRHKYGYQYDDWSLVNKSKARGQHLNDAAKWFYTELYKASAKNVNWNKQSAARKSNAVLERFDRKYRRFRQSIGQALQGIKHLPREFGLTLN